MMQRSIPRHEQASTPFSECHCAAKVDDHRALQAAMVQLDCAMPIDWQLVPSKFGGGGQPARAAPVVAVVSPSRYSGL